MQQKRLETIYIWNIFQQTIHKTREGGNYNDVLPLKAARRDSTSNLTSFGASNLSCRQTQCGFHSELLWAATLMSLRRCAMNCDGTK